MKFHVADPEWFESVVKGAIKLWGGRYKVVETKDTRYKETFYISLEESIEINFGHKGAGQIDIIAWFGKPFGGTSIYSGNVITDFKVMYSDESAKAVALILKKKLDVKALYMTKKQLVMDYDDDGYDYPYRGLRASEKVALNKMDIPTLNKAIKDVLMKFDMDSLEAFEKYEKVVNKEWYDPDKVEERRDMNKKKKRKNKRSSISTVAQRHLSKTKLQ